MAIQFMAFRQNENVAKQENVKTGSDGTVRVGLKEAVQRQIDSGLFDSLNKKVHARKSTPPTD